ncbi:MAG: ferritin-like domain-containing protein [Paludisphaera borealis]|uniref:ferritin-like domain-containing protein n=1 Tax=Paludisphaera borealis TaxID=1387353 RepID=UPI00284FA976|nr:ferritin-like domain-containing protein [Paludisphaera borealis]MDR3618005.1 ferritin-like domain-containing protein [Paludisphaera borealis]
MDSCPRPDSAPRNDARRSFLKTVLTTAAAAPVVLGATSTSLFAQSPDYLPTLYRGWNVRNFQDILSDENAHVEYLLNGLGTAARPKPTFKNLLQSHVLDFAMVSRALENTGVGAYLGALPLLAGTPYLSPAGSIALIEARHAGYLNTLLNLPITQNVKDQKEAFDLALTPEEVVALAGPFVVDLNGGPPLIPAGGLQNPIDVLNFALALEFLEAEFYNLNVPKFT